MTTRNPSQPTASPQAISLDSYFERIGYTGKVDTSLATLTALHERHSFSVPFENLDVLLGRDISLAPERLAEKLIVHKRGGYCFEQNSLFASVLRQIGFTLTPMIARVRWQVPSDVTTPKTHMVLQVETNDGPYLADVGFGGVGLVEPIALKTDIVQHERFEPRRIAPSDSALAHQVLVKDEWEDVYHIEPARAYPVDLEVANWYSYTHPQTRIRQDLLVTLVSPEKRTILFNTEFTERFHSGEVAKQEVSSYQEMETLLRDAFGLTLPPKETLNGPNIQFRNNGQDGQ